MKISASSIDLASQHTASSSHSVEESLRVWRGDRRPDFEGRERGLTREGSAGMSPGQAFAAASVSISSQALAAQSAEQATATPSSSSSGAQAIQESVDAVENDPRMMLIRHLVKMLTGQDVRVVSAADFQVSASVSVSVQAGAASAGAPARAGFGVEYDRHEIRSESEQAAFQAQGVIRTSDGREIGFQIDLLMQRSHTEESSVSLRAGDGVRKDPLVINFGGTAAQLQSQRFSFDLEGDGKKEKVAMFASNSGYLALDLNNNGSIDSGKELFGVSSGDGFADLARYDQEGNGWIDESDAVYDRLRVWTPTADGKGTLAGLRERQVGALYLGKTATPFELRDAGNPALSLGGVRASGVWLGDDGKAGSLQQIDLTV